MYSFDATIASSKSGGMFHLAEYGLDSISFITEFVDIPKTGGNSVVKTLHGNLRTKLTAGRHVFTLLIDKGGFYIKEITLNRYETGAGMTCRLRAFPARNGVGDIIPIGAIVSSKNSPISHVNFYANGMMIGTATEAPYTVNFEPTEMGTYSITAILTTEDGKEKVAQSRNLDVNSSTPVGINSLISTDSHTQIYNLMGIPVGESSRGIVVINGKKVLKK